MKKLLFLLSLLFTAGCASVSVQKYYQDVVYPPTKPASIVVLPDKPAEKAFIELGEITVTGASDWPQVEKVFRDKAAEMGANAVYVFSKQIEKSQYLAPNQCYAYHGYYYPYQHFGWRHFRSGYYYPRGYYYCYGYQPTLETAEFISAVGIAIKYKG